MTENSQSENRPLIDSLIDLTQREVIKYGDMTKDPYGYIFSAQGHMNGGIEKPWRIGINIEKNEVFHWGHGF